MLGDLLAGIRVIDLTQNVAGPFCTQILGDFGADIIKVERPGRGDDTRSWVPQATPVLSSTFAALNRSKRSICIDLNTPEGLELVRDLATGADIVIHSMKPASASKRGLDGETLRALNPRLVHCAISAFGNTGKMADLPGYDPLMQAFTGIMSVTGNEGDDPVRVSVSLIDMGTGLWAALGIFAALMSRQKTGQGMQVDASLLETGLSWMTIFIASYLASGTLPEKLGSAMSMTVPYQLFPSRDGHVFIAAGNDQLFIKVCEALECVNLLDDARFVTNPQRVAYRAELVRALSDITRKQPTADLVERLRAVGAPCSELQTIDRVLVHDQVQATGIVSAIPDSDIPALKTVSLPLRLNNERAGEQHVPPALGAHTTEVLLALGMTEHQLNDLRQRGVIA